MITENECKKIKGGDTIQLAPLSEIRAAGKALRAPIFSTRGGDGIGKPINIVPAMFPYLGKAYTMKGISVDISDYEDSQRIYLNGPEGIEEYFFNRYMISADQGISDERIKRFNEEFSELF